MKTKAHTIYRSRVKFQKNGKGIRLPGVTTVTGQLAKPALIKWANKIGLEGIEVGKYVDDKADIGTLAHAMITDKLSDKDTDTSDYSKNQIDQAENAVLSYLEWDKKHEVESIMVEEPLISDTMGFGGTADIYAKVDGVFELIDLKTGSGIYPEMFAQVSAYQQLLIENGHPVDRVRVLNIPRVEDENFQEVVVADLETHWQIFKALLRVYQLQKGANKNKQVEYGKVK